MRYGRISEVDIIDSYILSEADSVDELDDSLAKLIPDEDEPFSDDKWRILEREGEKYTITAKWLSFPSHRIESNDEFGKFPFNVTKWEKKFDIDINIRTEENSTGNTSDTDTTTSLIGEVTIYNPPKYMVNNVKLSKMSKLINGVYDEVEGVHGLNKFMNIKTGYYGKYGLDIPNIFRGKIEEISIEDSGIETNVNIVANGSAEMNKTFNENKQYIGRVDDVIEELCKDANATPGRVVYQFEYNDELLDLMIEKSDDFVVEANTSIIDAVSGADGVTGILNDKYNLSPRLVSVTSTGTINIVPENWGVYKGIELTPQTGLTNITKRKDMDVDNEYGGSSSSPYTLEALFLPEIEYRDVIKAKLTDTDEWIYLLVDSFEHTINHNEVATTTLSCKRLEEVVKILDGDQVYSLKSQNPYARSQTGYDVYTLTG